MFRACQTQFDRALDRFRWFMLRPEKTTSSVRKRRGHRRPTVPANGARGESNWVSSPLDTEMDDWVRRPRERMQDEHEDLRRWRRPRSLHRVVAASFARRSSGRGSATCLPRRLQKIDCSQARIDTVSNTAFARSGSPSMIEPRFALSGSMPLVKRRQASSWSIVTDAAGVDE